MLYIMYFVIVLLRIGKYGLRAERFSLSCVLVFVMVKEILFLYLQCIA